MNGHSSNGASQPSNPLSSARVQVSRTSSMNGQKHLSPRKRRLSSEGVLKPSYLKHDITDFSGESKEEFEARKKRMEGAVKTLIECVGENPERSGLLKTPHRFAEAFLFFCQGYTQTVVDVVGDSVFEEGHNEMVLLKDIEFSSLCEHHLVPFTGKVHIAYIPRNRVLGLSKFARIIEVFARRLQVQERLTTQICEAIVEVLDPRGVGVVVSSKHMCMTMRGVQKTSSFTMTSCVRGVFKTDHRTRQEFFSLVNSN